MEESTLKSGFRVDWRGGGGNLAAAVGTKWRVGGGKGSKKRLLAGGVIRVTIK